MEEMESKLEYLNRLMEKIDAFAKKKKHAEIIPEHMLLVLLHSRDFKALAKDKGIMLEEMRDAVNKYLAHQKTTDKADSISVSKEYMLVVRRCIRFALQKDCEFSVEHCVNALISLGKGSTAANLLLSAGFVADIPEEETMGELASYAVEMVSMAKEGCYDRLIGRQEELNRIIQILHKKRTCNPMLIAQPGVGKTAIVKGLAKKIADGDVPDGLKDAKVWALDLGAMLAGAKFRGDFEGRFKNAIECALSAKNSIVFIDEIHSLVGAGASMDNPMDAGNILKPYLEDKRFRCIGATTYDEYRTSFQKKPALARRFRKIEVAEPTQEETLEILKGVREAYQTQHGVQFPDEVIESIVSLSGQYLREQFFPAKAIEVMDEIGSRYASGECRGTTATVGDVEELIARMANIPSVRLKSDNVEMLRNLCAAVKSELYGQDDIVDRVVQHIKIAKAGLTNKTKPLGVFALLGSTGCGKTELVKQIAKNLDCSFLRFDMSEYSEKGSVAKLVGTAPGYVGFEQAGALTEAVFRNPNSVILFDEIEKADPAIYNLLLQVMDEGRLADNTNRTAEFNNTVIFMTGNVGSARAAAARNSIGFGGGEEQQTAVLDKELLRTFPPEFRNRFTDILRFNPLDRTAFARIVEKEIRKLNEKLSERAVVVSLSKAAQDFIIDSAISENMGGRPVERLVSKHVAEKLVDAILFENLQDKVIQFEVRGSTLEFQEAKLPVYSQKQVTDEVRKLEVA